MFRVFMYVRFGSGSVPFYGEEMSSKEECESLIEDIQARQNYRLMFGFQIQMKSEVNGQWFEAK